MQPTGEAPVNAKTARQKLGWSSSYMSAVKKAMGIRSRYFFLADVRKFIREHPTFRSTQIYHRPECKCLACMKKKSSSALEPAQSASLSPKAFQPTCPSMPQPIEPTYKIKDWNRVLFARRLRSIRGDHSFGFIAKRAGLSTEGVRRAECGNLPKIVTLDRIAKAAQATDEERLALKVLWLKATVGEESARLQIEIAPAPDLCSYNEVPPRTSTLIAQLNTLDSEAQETILDLIQSKEALSGLCAIISRLGSRMAPRPKSSDRSHLNDSSPGDQPYPADIDDLWANL